MKTASVAIVLLGLFILLDLVPSEAQMELPNLLVGKWEGKVQFTGAGSMYHDPNRRLIIKSVREEGGAWIVEAEFGADRLWRPAETRLEVSAGKVNLQLRFWDNTRVELLHQEKTLDGYMWPGKWAGQMTGMQLPLRLKKVE